MADQLPKLLTPYGLKIPRSSPGMLILLALSLAAILAAPLLMPAGYSWLTHTTSEAAAQALEGAWLTRLGFLLFGLAVLWLAFASLGFWARAATWMHLAFGVLMIATAAFSHRPFIAGVPFDLFEDLLHSITATVMGFAFSFGVLARFFQREGRFSFARIFDLFALGAAIVIPILMAAQTGPVGLVQRVMFVVAYAWYVKEAYALHIGCDRDDPH